MKKAIILLGICGVIMACNSGKSDSAGDNAGANQSAVAQQPDADTNVNKTGASSTASSANGEELINKSDCLTCHKVDTKILGPSYQEVAAKYEATDENIEKLAKKIIEGGGGVWGDLPMAPHPGLSSGDAQAMVKYILSLKK